MRNNEEFAFEKRQASKSAKFQTHLGNARKIYSLRSRMSKGNSAATFFKADN